MFGAPVARNPLLSLGQPRVRCSNSTTYGSLVLCRAAKTLVYKVSLPYSGVSQLCLVLPTTATVTVAAYFTEGGNITYSYAKVSETLHPPDLGRFQYNDL